MPNKDLEEVLFNVLREFQEATGVNIDPINTLRKRLLLELEDWINHHKESNYPTKTEDALDERRHQHSSDNIEFLGASEDFEFPSTSFTTLFGTAEKDK